MAADTEYYEHQAFSRNTMNYVKWKTRALRYKQYVVMATIFMVTSLAVVVFFVLLISGVITFKRNSTNSISITKEEFGTTQDNIKIYRYTMKSKNDNDSPEVQILSLGCTIMSIKVPDKNGHVDDVILGFDDLHGYQSSENSYFGAVLGRFANKVAEGRFVLGNKEYILATNDGYHHLNGGTKGWDQAVWNGTMLEDELIFDHVSPDGDEHFPGEVLARVSFQLDRSQLIVTMMAEIKDRPSPINVAIQPYINLAGQGAGNIYNHTLEISADKYLITTEDLVPTGQIFPVDGTPLDFRNVTPLGDRLSLLSDRDGLDHVYCVRGASGKRRVARVTDSQSGRVLEVYSNQPAVHVYTGNRLDVKHGKSGSTYNKHSAFCIVPQSYPDAVNHDNFPDTILYPESIYIHTTWFKFSIAD